MKKVLVICPTYSKYATTPSGKIIYKLVQYISTNFDIQITVLTRMKNARSSKNTDVIIFDTEQEYYTTIKNKLIDRCKDKSKYLRPLSRLLIRYINLNFDRGHYSNEIIFYKQYHNWINSHKNDGYDSIFCVLAPYSSLKLIKCATSKIKAKLIPYILEPWADHYSTTDKNRKKRIKDEKYLFSKSYKIFTYNELLTKSKASQIHMYRDKLIFIPTNFIDDYYAPDAKKERSDNTVHCVFAGIFYSNIREPYNLLHLIKYLPENFVLDIYSRGGTIKNLELYQKEANNRIHLYSFISNPKEYIQTLSKADILFSVGNSVCNEIPSKLFEYCSFRKPIVHFLNCDMDESPLIFKNYPIIDFIKYNDDPFEMAQRIVSFYDKVRGYNLKYEYIEKTFYEYTIKKVATDLFSQF